MKRFLNFKKKTVIIKIKNIKTILRKKKKKVKKKSNTFFRVAFFTTPHFFYSLFAPFHEVEDRSKKNGTAPLFFLHPFFLLCIFFAHFLLRSFFCRAKKKLRGKKEANCIFYCSAVKKAEQKNEQKKRSGRAQKKKRNDLFYAAGKKKEQKIKKNFYLFLNKLNVTILSNRR